MPANGASMHRPYGNMVLAVGAMWESAGGMQRFHLVDRYLGEILGIDLTSMESGERRVVESPRRLRCEKSYGFVHALLGLWFSDGRVAISVTPGAADDVADVLARHKPGFEGDFHSDLLLGLRQATSAARAQLGISPPRDASESWLFACRSVPESPPVGGGICQGCGWCGYRPRDAPWRRGAVRL